MGRRSKDGAVGKETDFCWWREAELYLYSGEGERALEIIGSSSDPSFPFISLWKFEIAAGQQFSASDSEGVKPFLEGPGSPALSL